jgi:hypothetical protein
LCRLQGLSLRRRMRWLRRWRDRRTSGMHRVLCVMGPLPLVLESSTP